MVLVQKVFFAALFLTTACVATVRHGNEGQQAGAARRLLAVRDGRGGSGGSLLQPGLSLQEAADARLCAMQCLQHACISWHKIYMGLGEDQTQARPQHPADVPAAAGECLARCGMPAQEAGCLAQTHHRLLNTSPMQYSCSSSCVAGLLHSSCNQCSGGTGASGCHALQLGATVQAAECLVDAAV